MEPYGASGVLSDFGGQLGQLGQSRDFRLSSVVRNRCKASLLKRPADALADRSLPDFCVSRQHAVVDRERPLTALVDRILAIWRDVFSKLEGC